jgi:hypothetical protein
MNITVNDSKVVHSTQAHGGTTCGSEYRKNRFGVGASRIHQTEAPVTCKTCIRRDAVEASHQEVVAQAVETLVQEAKVEAPVIRRQRCACCQETIRGTKEEISAHSAACWTAAKARG